MITSIHTPSMCIVLSGLPCTGKSTWSEQFTKASTLHRMTVKVISSDEISYQICKEHNEDPQVLEKINYAKVWEKPYRQKIEDRYNSTILEAKKEKNLDVIILDRTYTTVAARSTALEFTKGIYPTHVISFCIFDEKAWKNKLEQRSKELNDKVITSEIIDKLKKDATLPKLEEGFNSIVKCPSISEKEWKNEFEESIKTIIEAYQYRANSKTILQGCKWCRILSFTSGQEWSNGKETLFIPSIATNNKYKQIFEKVAIIAASTL